MLRKMDADDAVIAVGGYDIADREVRSQAVLDDRSGISKEGYGRIVANDVVIYEDRIIFRGDVKFYPEH